MRLVIIHDSEGMIITLAAPPNGLPVSKILKPGEHMTKLEVPDITPNLNHEEIMKHLLDILDNYKVDTSSNIPKLTKLDENKLQKLATESITF
ncbi:hypothetical protein V7457_13430 [Bacillus toyonensis]|uniref:hypothetical protein n=1 Tax=Bacillus toyonensis TaxID=155322 RepID=UPI002FFDF6E7